MADVKTININSTDYDIKDAKALRNKDTVGTDSFIDTRAGDTTYPTTGTNVTNSIIIGDKAIVSTTNSVTKSVALGSNANVKDSYATAIGSGSQATGWASTAIGDASYATQSSSVALGYYAGAAAAASVAVGNNAYVSGGYSVSIGGSAQTSGTYSCSLGFNARTTSNNSLALGSSSSIGNYSQYAIVIGYGASISGTYKNYAIALGGYATVNASYAAQIGSGTNDIYGSLKFRDWQLLDNDGKIPFERLPEGTKIAGITPPDLYDWSSYEENDDKVELEVYLWTGDTNALFNKDQFYKGKVNYSYPRVRCTWTNSDYVASKKDIVVDQQQLFQKFAEISQDRIDDGNTGDSIVGGDNSSQDIYFYYDASNSQWRAEFSNSSIKSGDSTSPAAYYFAAGETLEDFGIYVSDGALTLPTGEDDEEILDIEYFAPIYCNSFDYNDNSFYFDYMKFMNCMTDSDYGFGVVISPIVEWEYTVGSHTYYMPVIPPTYTYNGDEWDYISIRFEWDNDASKWVEYINGDSIGYSWTTAQMMSVFGIDIYGEETDVEYIGFEWKAARQCTWEQFDPVNMSNFATSADITTLTNLVNGKMPVTVESSTSSITSWANTKTDTGIYIRKSNNIAVESATFPGVTQGTLFVFNHDVFSNNMYITQMFVGGGVDMSNNINRIWIRRLAISDSGAGTLTATNWVSNLTIYTAGEIASYNSNQTQVISHDSSGNMRWVADSGGSTYTAGDGIDITNDVISVDDLDCGTM